MNQLQIWGHSAIGIAISKTLLHSLWEGGIVAIALAVLLSFLHSSRMRYICACLALLVVAGASIGTFLYFTSEVESGFRSPIGPIPQPALNPGQFAGTSSSLGLKDVLPWLSPLWLIGLLIFSFKNIGCWITAERMRRRGVCLAPEVWQSRLNAIRNTLGISSPVALLESCLVHVPVVIGYARPVILVPVGILAGLPVAQMEMILMHELQHIRRYDYVVNVIQTCVEGVLFYNPTVWWISRIIRTERELCCDDLVVAATKDAHGYARALTTLEETRRNFTEMAIASNGGNLMKRIHRLLHRPSPGIAVLPLFSAGLLVVVTAVMLGSPALPPGSPEPPFRTAVAIRALAPPSAPVPFSPTPSSQSPGPQQTVSTALMRWLDEDVAYIISNEERYAFVQLPTNEEREHFVEQFWQRRDPSPGTPDNEFRNEHYRRIVYANQHFSATGKAGWITDRGRIYIIWGEPQELESHGSSGVNGPFELWLYSHIDGIGDNVLAKFVDTTGSGDYRLAGNPVPLR